MNDFFSSVDYLEIESKLKILASDIWDNAIKMPEIEEWLSQFTGQILSEQEEKIIYDFSTFKVYIFQSTYD